MQYYNSLLSHFLVQPYLFLDIIANFHLSSRHIDWIFSLKHPN